MLIRVLTLAVQWEKIAFRAAQSLRSRRRKRFENWVAENRLRLIQIRGMPHTDALLPKPENSLATGTQLGFGILQTKAFPKCAKKERN